MECDVGLCDGEAFENLIRKKKGNEENDTKKKCRYTKYSAYTPLQTSSAI